MMDKDAYDRLGHHEDDLVNHRLTWLLLSQTVLFAGFGQIVVANNIPEASKQSILTAIILVGGGSSALIWLGVLGAVMAGLHLWKDTNNHSKKQNGEHIRLGVRWWTTWLGWIPPLTLPILFVIVWDFLWRNH